MSCRRTAKFRRTGWQRARPSGKLRATLTRLEIADGHPFAAGHSCTGLCTLSVADEPSFGPIIEGYGPTYPIGDRDVPLPENFTYKAVFDLAKYPGETSALNPYLVSVARFLNMHARNGVPAENMELAVVVHGAAVKNLLNDHAYESRYEVQESKPRVTHQATRRWCEDFCVWPVNDIWRHQQKRAGRACKGRAVCNDHADGVTV